MNSVKFFGFIFVALCIFEKGNTLLCVICQEKNCGNENRTVIAECNHGLVETTNKTLHHLYPDLKVEASNKFSCLKAEITTKATGKDEEKVPFKGCMYANVDVCKQGRPKNVPDIIDFTCNQCTSDRCNGASALTQSVIFLTISFLFVLLTKKM